MSKLTAKQSAFVKEYLIDLNGAKAAIRAGYSKNSAKEISSENLTKPNILQAIEKAMKKRSDRVEITADMVLKELGSIAFSKNDEYKLADKIKCLELLGKNLVLFTDRRIIEVVDKKVKDMTDAELYQALEESRLEKRTH